jgi:hypothetical protein
MLRSSACAFTFSPNISKITGITGNLQINYLCVNWFMFFEMKMQNGKRSWMISEDVWRFGEFPDSCIAVCRKSAVRVRTET